MCSLWNLWGVYKHTVGLCRQLGGGGDLRPQVAAREEGGWHELLTGKKHTPRHQATGPQSACRNDSE